MSHSTHYRSFRGRFYGSNDPTNSVTALKDELIKLVHVYLQVRKENEWCEEK